MGRVYNGRVEKRELNAETTPVEQKKKRGG